MSEPSVTQQELDDAAVSQEAQDAGPVREFPDTPGPAPPPPRSRQARPPAQQEFTQAGGRARQWRA